MKANLFIVASISFCLFVSNSSIELKISISSCTTDVLVRKDALPIILLWKHMKRRCDHDSHHSLHSPQNLQ